MSNKYKYQKLFTPIKIGNCEIPNRYFMAPMAPAGMVEVNGTYNNKAIEYYAERARGGTGLIITGVVKAESIIEYLSGPSIAIIDKEPGAFVQTAKIITERVQAYGSKIFLQIGFGFGRVMFPPAIKKRSASAIAPSKMENRWDPSIIHRELTTEEVQSIIKATVKAALLAKRCGFDGVEIHAVHEGYLLDQFTMDVFNQRTDQYGGSFENRYRAAVEIVQGIKELCGRDFPVSLRYSAKSFMKGICKGALPGETFQEMGRDIDEGVKAARYLEAAGYDALNVDTGCYDSWYWNHPPMYFEDGMYLPWAKVIKEAVSIPVLVAGRMDDPDLALRALEDNLADMIGLGRPLLADAFLPNKVRHNKIEEIRPCLSCHDGCLSRLSKGWALSCTVNPACGREAEYRLTKANTQKKVLVIGGGVAGMEAALVAHNRGHIVELFEKSDKLGGSLIPGGVPDFKRHDRKLVDWYKNELRKAKIPVYLNSNVSKEMVENSDYDVIVVATGAKPVELDLPGKEKNRFYHAADVLLDENKAGDSIVIIGAGYVGCETALWLAKAGKKVTVIEMTGEILGGEHDRCFANYDMLKDLLDYNNVRIMTHTTAREITESGIIVESIDSGKEELSCDTIISAAGYQSCNSFYDEIKFIDKDIFIVGDAKKVNNIMYAIWDANEIARHI
ncbi:MAG: FAD-dependent oxidoreductase [Syntrophomonadaceae bacterium]|nr:FAD-dependent oxidoreductase [Syntrophomonadaceae bacterium]